MFGLFKNRTDRNRELAGMLDGYEPPSFPGAVMGVLALLRDPKSSLNEIAGRIEMDPGMQVKVLRTVNSAAFGLATNVSNVRHAATLLGRSRLESIILALAIKKTIPAPDRGGFDMQEFWLASARRGSFSRFLAKRLHPATQIESFSGGFLQDMAVPVLVKAKGDDYVAVYSRWVTEAGAQLDVLERETFGYDHQTVGALLAMEWELPEYLVNAISLHHGSHESGDVEAAVRMVAHIKRLEDPDGTEVLIDLCRSEFGLDPEALEDAKQSAFESAQVFAEMLK